MSEDYWRLQLETVRQHADGIVIWGGWNGNGPARWDNAMPCHAVVEGYT